MVLRIFWIGADGDCGELDFISWANCTDLARKPRILARGRCMMQLQTVNLGMWWGRAPAPRWGLSEMGIFELVNHPIAPALCDEMLLAMQHFLRFHWRINGL